MGDLASRSLIIDDPNRVKRYHHHRYGHVPYTPRPFESKIPMHLRTQPPERTLFNYWRLLDIVFVFTFIGIWWYIDRRKGIEISENGNGMCMVREYNSVEEQEEEVRLGSGTGAF